MVTAGNSVVCRELIRAIDLVLFVLAEDVTNDANLGW